jgi:hypothetical protein
MGIFDLFHRLPRNSPTLNNVEHEIGVLLRNVPILIGRGASPVEGGLATSVFCYWQIGFDTLSQSEKANSALNFLNDSRHCVRVIYHRLLQTSILSSPDAVDLDSYVESQIEDVGSLLGAVNQAAHILAESYMNTLGSLPVSSSWELMPRTAAMEKRQRLEALMRIVRTLCSDAVANAILPQQVIDSEEGLELYGRELARGFLVNA